MKQYTKIKLKKIILVLIILGALLLVITLRAGNGFTGHSIKDAVSSCNKANNNSKELYLCYNKSISNLTSLGSYSFYADGHILMEFIDLSDATGENIVYLKAYTVITTISLGDEGYAEALDEEYICSSTFKNASSISDNCIKIDSSP